VSQLP